MIYRVQRNKENPYFLLNRAAMDDERLSYKAVGILSYLLSKPDFWTVQEADLVSRHTDGSHAVRAGLAELKKYGYFQKVPIRDEATGRITGWETHVFETPRDAETHNVENPPSGESTNRKTEDIVINDLLVSNELTTAATAAAQTKPVVTPKPPTPTAAIPKPPPATQPPTRNRKTDPEWDALCRTYENEIGLLTPIIEKHLGELADKYPLPWITEALAEAVKANVRKLNYAARILERWHTEGRETVNANRNYAPTTYHNGKSSTPGRDNSPPRRDNGLSVQVPEDDYERVEALLAGKPWPPVAPAQSG